MNFNHEVPMILRSNRNNETSPPYEGGDERGGW